MSNLIQQAIDALKPNRGLADGKEDLWFSVMLTIEEKWQVIKELGDCINLRRALGLWPREKR